MGSSFEELEVWGKSCRLSVRLYKLLRDCRDYGMKDQMLRSSISIPSNIAERNRFIDFFTLRGYR
ncbi:MAG: four helix bundle protein [Proteobacteria bacterium]|nr:four helix bundle protein [Desulfobacteraceae bacterium]MBU4012094.1 four helix bundle protein [Pseudomonadota bacterium]MBU4068907.1 four helix bundle protein [Pseudomonadota bacterium]MBU4128118.1 four helix bundle protein [Pseudomonadota bacterium]